jgi:hypothetical protein
MHPWCDFENTQPGSGALSASLPLSGKGRFPNSPAADVGASWVFPTIVEIQFGVFDEGSFSEYSSFSFDHVAMKRASCMSLIHARSKPQFLFHHSFLAQTQEDEAGEGIRNPR